MKKSGVIMFLVGAVCLLALALTPADGASPKGAKALFDSGEGPSVAVSSRPAPATPGTQTVQKERYIGISYQLLLVGDDGQFRVVPKTRTFRSGERIKMLVRTNRPGYMTILNVGPTGNTTVLYNEYVDAFSFVEVPKTTNMVFTGAPGTEKLLVMLSDNPNPLGGQAPPAGPVTAGGTGSYPGSDMSTPVQPPPTGTYAGGTGYPPSTGSGGYTAPPPPVDTGAYPTPPSGTTAGTYPPPPTYPASSGPMPPQSGDMSLPIQQGSGSASAQLPPPPPAAMIASNIEGAKGIKGSKDIVAEDSMKNSFTVISPKHGYKPVRTGTKDIVLESSGGTNYGVIPASAAAGGGILTLEVKLTHR